MTPCYTHSTQDHAQVNVVHFGCLLLNREEFSSELNQKIEQSGNHMLWSGLDGIITIYQGKL